MRTLVILATLLCTTATVSPVAAGQSVDLVVAIRSSQAGPSDQPSAAPSASAVQQTGSGLPQRDPPARTMRAYWHVFIAFAVTWILLFGFALSLGRRFGRLEEEVQRLGGG